VAAGGGQARPVPELPEVETTRRALARRLRHARIEAVELRRRDLRTPVPADLPARLAGRRLVAFGRRGKYLLLVTDGPEVLLVHLGMSGRLVLDGPPRPHTHLRLRFSGGAVLDYVDPRRFGTVDLVPRRDLLRDPRLAVLGPEPLAPGFDATGLGRALVGRRAAIRDVLLDQRVVAGLGNIYVCEALFAARIHPFAPAATLGPRTRARLVAAIRKVLEEAIGAGGSTLRDYVAADGRLGRFQNAFRVYGRAGAPCPRCGGAVVREARGGRSSFFCPRCQRRRRVFP